MLHPYKNYPYTSFWSKSVVYDFDPTSIILPDSPLLRRTDKVMSAGSCFAANIVPYIEAAGLEYIRTEKKHPIHQRCPPENYGYENFSAAYGHIYTVRQLLQLIKRALGLFHPIEDRLSENGRIIDVFRPGLRYPAASDVEFDLLNKKHLDAVSVAFKKCDVFIFTLGLTEAWMSRTDGSVYPVCPGTIAGAFDPEKHRFINFSAAEVIDDLIQFLDILRDLNPNVRVVLSVSPVPLIATATSRHVVTANSYSKAVLRVAVDEIARRYEFVRYFPAYEIITGPQAPNDFWESDRRNPSRSGIEAVMKAFSYCCELTQDGALEANISTSPHESLSDRVQAHPSFSGADAAESEVAVLLSRQIVSAECEEAMINQIDNIRK
ncbi:GSCFA domain-containing protein [Methylorubrum extorquens]|uniref:GSCFA domain-containing protein n=1 Tax=Methylorubrum extorquens TaxID=408 RepID=UPI002237A73A|nr:GSCFA domain-containing protein [Methylorubrum extorquens]UYW30167.1 GSCFA domain-containing protein [Methylorubrum extorquens]